MGLVVVVIVIIIIKDVCDSPEKGEKGGICHYVTMLVTTISTTGVFAGEDYRTYRWIQKQSQQSHLLEKK